jgi:hypothetical protein
MNDLFVEKWIEVEIIRLSKMRQTEKDKYCMFSLLWNLDKKEMSVKQGYCFGWKLAQEGRVK